MKPGLPVVSSGILALCLSLAPAAADAQQAGKVYRLGWLAAGSAASTPHLTAATFQALQDRGWVQGRNLTVEYRFAGGRFDRLPALAADLMRAKPDVVFAAGDQVIKAAKDATRTVPIVMIACDAVAAGLVASLARPGGNLTGITCISREIAGKRMELLRAHLPGLERLAVLYNPDDPGKTVELKETEAAGRALGLGVTAVPLRDPGQFGAVFAAMTRDRRQAAIVLGDAFTVLHRKELVRLAEKHRLPVAYAYREFVDSGGLMSYGPDLAEMFRASAVYIDKILRGAAPADLPVEQPTRFELVLNRKAARALDLTIPPSVLLQANQIVER